MGQYKVNMICADDTQRGADVGDDFLVEMLKTLLNIYRMRNCNIIKWLGPAVRPNLKIWASIVAECIHYKFVSHHFNQTAVLSIILLFILMLDLIPP